MTDMSSYEKASELLALKEQMDQIISEVESLLPQYSDCMTAKRAHAYWLSHIKAAVGGYGYHAMATMEEACKDLESEDHEEEK